jgi:S-methylmethionine-dependent homocysteine/selenocysteine methylase
VGIIYGDAITLETLKEFLWRRVQVLAEAGDNITAFETIPNKLEAQVFAKARWFSVTL